MAPNLMITIDVWNSLDANRVLGEELVARRIQVDGDKALLCGVQRNGSRHFLVPIDKAEDMPPDDKSRGLRARVRELFVSGRPPGWYVDVECSDRDMHDPFDVVGNDLLRALRDSSLPPVALIQTVLAKWRRFWAEIPNQVLGEDAIAGLFGELWFLQVWLAPAIGHRAAIESWRGPTGARHDFQAIALAVEAKTTRSTRGRIHTINGVDQLELPESGELLFFSLRVQREVASTNNLPSIIGLVRAAIVDDPESASAFDNALAKAGCLDVHFEHYLESRFRIVDSHLYEVNAAFPSITRHSFSNGDLPEGVLSLGYEINLDGSGAARLAARPEEAQVALRRMLPPKLI